MRTFLLSLVLALFTVQQVLAAPVPVSNMQNAISGVVQAKMMKRGFAANDPRFGATLQTAGTQIAGAAAAAALVTAAGVTAPAWLTAGVAVGLGALLGMGLDLAIDGIKWLLNPDGSVSAPGATTPLQPYMGRTDWVDGSYVEAIHLNGSCLPDVNGTNGTLSGKLPFNYWCAGPGWPGDTTLPMNGSILNATGTSPASSGTGTSTTVPDMPSAISALSPEMKARPLNPQIIAAIADSAWKQAASQPGYAGLPYDAANPITTVDAQAWQQANPTNWPTVGDAAAPQAAPVGGTAASPFSLPNTSGQVVSTADPATDPSTGVNPASSQAQSNLGPDPGIGAPGLEATPTAQMILQPVLSLLPSMRNFVVPSHQSVCPTPSVDVFGKHLVLDAQCTMAEQSRTTLYMVMGFVWLFLAVLVILAA